VSESSPSRNIYVFGITSFLNDTASEMAYWVLPAFLVSLGAGPAQLGLIEGIAESVASFAKLFSGYLTDRIDRRKPIVVAGYAAANTVKPLLALATVWWHVLLIRFTDRLAKGVRGAPRDVMVAETVPKERLGSAYGLIQSMDSAGAIAGPLIALVFLARYGIKSVFWAAAIPGALCVLAAMFGIVETKRSESSESATEKSQKLVATLTQGPALPSAFYLVLAAVTLFSLGNSSDMFLVMRAQNVGIPVAMAPLLGLVFNITYTLGSWPTGWFSDRFSQRWIAAAGYVIFAAVYFVFGRAINFVDLDFNGSLRHVLRAHRAGAEIADRAIGGCERSRTRLGSVCPCDKRGYAGRKFDHRRTVEALRRANAILFFRRNSIGVGVSPAGARKFFSG
jgi:MFS family permease